VSLLEFISTYWPRLLSGTGITVAQFFLSAFFAVVLSLIFGLMKLSPNRLVKGVAVTYIEIFRGTSLLVQLYWIFFVLPLFGVT
jgi:polar amino acid transport system permease protein